MLATPATSHLPLHFGCVIGYFGHNYSQRFGEWHEDHDCEGREVWLRPAHRPCRSAPVAVAKHGRPVVVVMAVEEFERLKALDSPDPPPVAK